ncbi:uncharacterized protein B0H64DRAFT_375984 [Chaetomium fimeti]|uniref:Extracellular membrane protein CFEM domain-containing protein n=1 Tax=Chaetomium fimeti TaxID=1854472 RepID=A0AAE0HAR0_9PEZI|nr:hypothetical protein B0H64DRAFT_375984 [Chaetomium fimeti]
MHLSLLLTLPLLAAATTTSGSETTPKNPRGITDKIKGAFGDAPAMARELSDCMALCVEFGIYDLDMDKCSLDNGAAGVMDCWCQDGDGDGGEGAVGQALENGVRECFETIKEGGRRAAMGCTLEGYEEGKMLGICGALEGESGEKKNETGQAIGERLRGVHAKEEERENGGGRKGAVSGGNGTGEGQGSGAAAAAGPGMTARVAGAAFAAAVAYAVAML